MLFLECLGSGEKKHIKTYHIKNEERSESPDSLCGRLLLSEFSTGQEPPHEDSESGAPALRIFGMFLYVHVLSFALESTTVSEKRTR